MNRQAIAFVLVLLVASTSCRGDELPNPPEVDHSQMDMGDAQLDTGAPQGDTENAPADATSGPSDRQAVRLTVEQERALGVVYMTVEERVLQRTIRTVGRIGAMEDMVANVTPKIDGYVEKLFVATTGAAVLEGQPLLTVYSPELVAAQEELLAANGLASRVDPAATEARERALTMLNAARRRLSYWDITEQQIMRLEATGEVSKTLTLVSPVSGIVLEKNVVEGQRLTAGTPLYRIADLSEVWVEGDVFEQDLQFIREGAQAHIEVSAYPGEHLMGLVSFVYPTVDVLSRTNLIRVTLPNPDLRLKPGMFATLFFDSPMSRATVAIPTEAAIITGERNVVFVRDSEGVLHPREVVIGTNTGDWVEILSGVDVGETIVQSANFLVDAESRLAGTAGMPGMQHAGHGAAVEPSAAPPPPGGPGRE